MKYLALETMAYLQKGSRGKQNARSKHNIMNYL